MPDKDYSNMGERIQSIVEDAVSSMDFGQLNKNITGSIQSVFEELNIDADAVKDRVNRMQESAGVRYHYGSDRPQEKKQEERKAQTTTVAKYAKNPPGTVSGTLCTALGGVFTGIFGISTVIVGLLGVAIPGFAFAGNIALASIVPFLILSLIVLWKGLSVRGRVKRFRNYVHAIGTRSYCQIRELAAATGKSEKYVVKDIQKLIENKSFLNGHMDVQKTCLMLDDKTYQQYLETQAAYQQRVLEEKKVQQSDREIFSSSNIANPEMVKAIEEGNSYILQIRRANEAIPGEEISAKLFRLEALIKKIFEVLKKKPDQLPKLRKFMNYYMPTTLKLVKTYQELDAQPVEGENIRRSKAEIEKTLDTINLAYEKLLDSFFEDAAMDISTDITVLETMFAQEGLTKKQFDNVK